jgi:hypothetical protein
MNTPLQIQPNSYIKVANGATVGVPFTLPMNYQADDGSITNNIADCPLAVKLALGLYPVIETLPVFDARYQSCTPVYAVHADYVGLSYSVADRPLEVLKQEAIAEVYRHCAEVLDAQSVGYSVVEIATFPLMSAEIVEFNASGSVGNMMQAVISRGRHTAESLSALLSPKISAQNAALQQRDERVAAIMLLPTPSAVAEYLMTI